MLKVKQWELEGPARAECRFFLRRFPHKLTPSAVFELWGSQQLPSFSLLRNDGQVQMCPLFERQVIVTVIEGRAKVAQCKLSYRDYSQVLIFTVFKSGVLEEFPLSSLLQSSPSPHYPVHRYNLFGRQVTVTAIVDQESFSTKFFTSNQTIRDYLHELAPQSEFTKDMAQTALKAKIACLYTIYCHTIDERYPE